jgi:hypothetical protein
MGTVGVGVGGGRTSSGMILVGGVRGRGGVAADVRDVSPASSGTSFISATAELTYRSPRVPKQIPGFDPSSSHIVGIPNLSIYPSVLAYQF